MLLVFFRVTFSAFLKLWHQSSQVLLIRDGINLKRKLLHNAGLSSVITVLQTVLKSSVSGFLTARAAPPTPTAASGVRIGSASLPPVTAPWWVVKKSKPQPHMLRLVYRDYVNYFTWRSSLYTPRQSTFNPSLWRSGSCSLGGAGCSRDTPSHQETNIKTCVIFSAVSQWISGLYWCSSLSLSLFPSYALSFLLLICMLLLSVSHAGWQVNCCMAVCLCVADFGAGPAAWWRSVSVPPTVHVVWPSAEPVEARRPEEGTCVYNFHIDMSDEMQVRLRWVMVGGHGSLFRSVYVRILVILNRWNLISLTGISRCFWCCFYLTDSLWSPISLW